MRETEEDWYIVAAPEEASIMTEHPTAPPSPTVIPPIVMATEEAPPSPTAIPPIVVASEEACITTERPKPPPSPIITLEDKIETVHPPLPPPPISTTNKFQLGGNDGTTTTSGMVDQEVVEDTAVKAKKETDDDVSISYNNFATLVDKWKELPVQPWEDPGPYEPGASPPQTNTGPTMSEWVKSVPDRHSSPTYLNNHHHPDNKHRSWDNWIRNWPQHAATA